MEAFHWFNESLTYSEKFDASEFLLTFYIMKDLDNFFLLIFDTLKLLRMY